jgi:hypothetical protein
MWCLAVACGAIVLMGHDPCQTATTDRHPTYPVLNPIQAAALLLLLQLVPLLAAVLFLPL